MHYFLLGFDIVLGVFFTLAILAVSIVSYLKTRFPQSKCPVSVTNGSTKKKSDSISFFKKVV